MKKILRKASNKKMKLILTETTNIKNVDELH
jgi:hypothetical protein